MFITETFFISVSEFLSFGYSKSKRRTKSSVEDEWWLPSIASGNNVWLSILDCDNGVLHNLYSSTEAVKLVPPNVSKLPLFHEFVPERISKLELSLVLILPWNDSCAYTSNTSNEPDTTFCTTIWVYSSLNKD